MPTPTMLGGTGLSFWVYLLDSESWPSLFYGERLPNFINEKMKKYIIVRWVARAMCDPQFEV